MKYMLVLLLGVSLLWSCGQKAAESEAAEIAAELPDGKYGGFPEFYERFMTDSIFQMEHITFPLQGLPSDAKSNDFANNEFRWQKEDWVMHQAFDPEKSGFKVEFIPISPSVIQERITHHTGQYGMMRRFAKLGDEWFLIYYAGLNRFAPPSEDTDEEGVPANAG